MINNFNTHVCLVSHEATPNITPILDPDVKPKKVILIVSPSMKQAAKYLTQVLKKDGRVKVEEWLIDDAWDIEHIRTRIMELLETLGDETVALNATGGTKPMSIAAFDVFCAYDKTVFYVHPLQDRLFWLYPTGKKSMDLANKAKLQHLLNASGAEIESRGRVNVLPNWKALTERLIQHIDDYAKPIRTLNFFAHDARYNLTSASVERELQRWPEFEALLDLFERENILKISKGKIIFADEDARFFANGGWLEQHVYSEVLALKRTNKSIQDVSQSLSVLRRDARGEPIRNELDVAFLAENNLYIIECKTKRFKYKNVEKGGGKDSIYKLNTLKDLYGGLHGKGMLISYLPLSEYDKRRAKDLNVKICEGAQIQHIKQILQGWI